MALANTKVLWLTFLNDGDYVLNDLKVTWIQPQSKTDHTFTSLSKGFSNESKMPLR